MQEPIWRKCSPDEIRIVVAGGLVLQDVYIAAGMPQTRKVVVAYSLQGENAK